MLHIKDAYLFEDEKPFFWLGDTAWLLFENLSLEEAKTYLKNRYSLGFNVIQATLLHTVSLNPSLSYFSHCKEIIKFAETLGIYMAILPCWGSYVKEGILNLNNVNKYIDFLSSYFKDCNHLVWVLGGDIRGESYQEIYKIFGNKLKKAYPNTLITFHPFGRTGSYLWFHQEDWLDFNMFQSGHRRYDQVKLGAWDDKQNNEDSYGEDNYKYVKKALSLSPLKPCLDGEPSYEGIVQGLHDFKEPYWEARHVRRYAYWSLFEGACGFTYGNNAVMQFYDGKGKGSYNVREHWQEALHSEGGAQMQYLKELMLSVEFTKGNAHGDLILNNQEKHHHISAFAGDDFIFVYTYLGDKLELNLKDYETCILEAYWMNPQNNSRSYIGRLNKINHFTICPAQRKELSNDWVLILKVMKDE